MDTSTPVPFTHGLSHDRALRLMVVLLACDLLLIILHAAHVLASAGDRAAGWLTYDALGLDQDRGAAEVYQYAKLLVVVVGLLLWHAQHRSPAMLAWAAAFGFVLVDDSMQVHENVGAGLADALTLPAVFGLREQDLGELLVWAVAGLVLGTAVLVAHRRTVGAERRTSLVLGVLFGLLIFCGLVLDMVHGALGGNRWVSAILTLAEDGGELLVVSFVVFVVASTRFAPLAPVAEARGAAQPQAQRGAV